MFDSLFIGFENPFKGLIETDIYITIYNYIFKCFLISAFLKGDGWMVMVP